MKSSDVNVRGVTNGQLNGNGPEEEVMPHFHCRVRNGSDRKDAVGRERFAQLSSEVAFPLPTVPLVVGRMSIAAASTGNARSPETERRFPEELSGVLNPTPTTAASPAPQRCRASLLRGDPYNLL
ncbi:unnamed protein product [Boreogadus saida]